MAKGISICKGCGKEVPTPEAKTYSSKKYCEECYIEKVEANKDYGLLVGYVCELYNIKAPHGMMLQQIKQYKDLYGYTNTGMYYTLKYFYNLLENEVKEDTGLGIIPYYYDKASKHYNKVYDLQDLSDDYNDEGQVVNIKSKIWNKKADVKKPLPLNIDWEDTDEN